MVFGEFAVLLCIIAVALIGALMLTGRLPLQRGLRVVLGCFILIGAPVIAGSLMTAGTDEAIVQASAAELGSLPVREELPPSEFNPYAQASVGGDR